MAEDAWLSVHAIAERLSVSEKAVRAAIRRGELAATKVCGRIRIAPEDFEAWVLQNRIIPQKKERYEPSVTSTPGVGLRSLLQELSEGATA